MMVIQCPKCGNEHVQAVSAILQSGTSFNSGTVAGATSSGSAGTFFGTTSSTSQTTLAARFSGPTKPVLWVEIANFLLALALTPLLLANSHDVPWRYLSMALWGYFAYSFWGYLKKSAIYKEQYPKWKEMHDNGFYCHRCGTSYIPQ